MAQPQPFTAPSAMFSLWLLKSLSYAPQQRRELILSIQTALGDVNGEIIQELARVGSNQFMVVVTSSLHPSKTASECHWTLRIFASTANGGSVYLGGVHAFPLDSSSGATFQRRSKDSRKSRWRHRTFAGVEAYELTATDG